MIYETGYYYAPQYEHTSGYSGTARFKRICSKQIIVARLSCEPNDAGGLKQLVLLSDRLHAPVRYDFEKQMAYIELMSADTVRGDK